MQWDATRSAGFSDADPWLPVADSFRDENVESFRRDKGSLYWLYRRLIGLRRKHVALDRVRQQSHHFDILHFHLDYLHFPLFRDISSRVLTTLHGRQDLPDNKPIYIGFDEMRLISISDSQRTPIPNANFAATIYHGLPGTDLKPTLHPGGGYLAFLGRIAPEKGPETAIQIAQSAGIPLKIAAKVDRVDEQYFRERIAPLLNQPGIEFIGEINEHQKAEFLGQASGLLFPIDWPEPFGLVMIEAWHAVRRFWLSIEARYRRLSRTARRASWSSRRTRRSKDYPTF
jgi:glycosyltransferase involved in cell wall biosynthesis